MRLHNIERVCGPSAGGRFSVKTRSGPCLDQIYINEVSKLHPSYDLHDCCVWCLVFVALLNHTHLNMALG